MRDLAIQKMNCDNCSKAVDVLYSGPMIDQELCIKCYRKAKKIRKKMIKSCKSGMLIGKSG